MELLDPATLAELPALIGSDRFAPYLAAQSGNQDEALRLYTWNIEDSAASGDLTEIEGAVEYLTRKKQHWKTDHVIAEMKPSFWEGYYRR